MIGGDVAMAAASQIDDVKPMSYKHALSLPNACKWKEAVRAKMESMWTNPSLGKILINYLLQKTIHNFTIKPESRRQTLQEVHLNANPSNAWPRQIRSRRVQR